MEKGHSFLAGNSGKSRANKIAPSWSLRQPITPQDWVHIYLLTDLAA